MTARARVLAYLHRHGPTSTADVAAALGYHPEHVRRSLAALVARGSARRLGVTRGVRWVAVSP